jgi:hypothetical protein
MKTDNKGIDYGLGKTNIDAQTGIRYGVIPQNEVVQAWCDIAEPFYGDDLPEDEDLDFIEPLSWFVDDGEYLAEANEAGDIFITKSPYFTYAQFCSPCAPGACYLMNFLTSDEIDHDWSTDNNRAYCFGHDWFDAAKAPYPVYDAKTGCIINPA